MNANPMRVLIAIDGSEPASIAVDLVANAAWPPGTEIVVAKAVVTGPDLFGGPWPALATFQADQIEAELRDQARRTVAAARERLERPGQTVEAVVLPGRPATAIVDKARAMRADLIVVGSLGHGTIESMLVGSVSAEVVDYAAGPVLVARGRRIERVVLAWDGSDGARRAADLLRTWPILAGSAVRVVSVADFGIAWWTGFPESGSSESVATYVEAKEASRGQHEVLARDMAAELQASGLSADAERREGDAATEILAAASAYGADIIVMGTRGRTGLARLVLGSVARNVLQHANCSVLVVRKSAPERTLLPGDDQ
jgi:nucleotide-binding universal stress UspA family protein